MRTKTVAVLAAVGLSTAVLAGAGSASAADDPSAPDGTRARAAEPLRQLRSAVAAEASSTTGAGTRSALSPRGNVRVSGRDRYETAAEVSFLTWRPGTASVVFLASGTSLPDALAVGPSANGLGPVLLTERDRLPAASRAELQRLQPCLVVVVGGTPSVSDAVFADAEQYTNPTGAGCPTITTVTR
ncbi:cell wall-binding repeat-containing protein [Kineococcus rhizosphaerae]|uniref:Putative cell wall binding repeat protein n=1 Tax=Kineococcus rhizosphaerae TaxID=559628 RepID=A0A2T0R6R1_9ACTN|nr:cell wall-binding repeat-containing protein [Kineococcus rhizosphaerae]PRY16854.1 putative cell wall binding repeat protein [Kineococcus rhizosphaerae]